MQLSILGIYQHDNSIFDDLRLPVSVNKDTLITNILMETAEVEVLYPNPTFLKFAIGKWSQKQLPVWEKLVATTQYEYDPIANYDRTEEWTVTGTRDSTETRKDDHTRTGNVSEKVTNERDLTFTSDTTSSNTSKLSEQGFNDGMLDTTNGTESLSSLVDSTDKGKIDTTNTKTDTETIGITGEKTDKDKTTESRSIRAYGNIGVTTTQQMIEAEREVVKFNIYDYILNEFRQRFCILVY